MKKLYLLLLSVLISIGVAQAQNVVTIEWDTPGAIQIVLGNWKNTPETLAHDQTSYTYDSGSMGAYIYALPAEGYAIEQATYVNGTKSGTIKPNTSAGYSISVMTSNMNYKGGTITIKTAKLEAETFTIDIQSGLDQIKKVYLSDNVAIDLHQGENTVSFFPAQDKKFTIEIVDVLKYEDFNITCNGEPVAWNTAYRCFYPDVAAGDKFVVNYTGKVEQATVTIDMPEALKDCLLNVFNRSTLSAVTGFETGKFTVSVGDRVAFSFKEDYDITSATLLNATGATINTFENPVEGFNFVVNSDCTLKIDGTAKTYTDITFTAYLTEAAGLEIYAGNMLGDMVNLGEGTLVEGPTALPAATSDGVKVYSAYTVPAGQLYKYTFTVSSKFKTLLVTEAEGYWIRSIRLSDPAEAGLNSIPTTETTFYVIGEKIENDSKSLFIVNKPADRQVKVVSSRLYGANITYRPADGESFYEYDFDYQSPFTIGAVGENFDQMNIYVNNAAEPVKPDDNMQYLIDLPNGSVVRIYADTAVPARPNLTFVGNNGTLTYDKIATYTDMPKPLALFAGTEVIVTPDEGYAVALDGNVLTPDADGKCTFTTTDKEATLEFIYEAARAVLFPESGSTVDNLDEIIVSFPKAKTAVRNPEADDSEAALMSVDNNYGNISITVETVADADVPTFKLHFTPAPALITDYRMVIESNFFIVDGDKASDQIIASYTLEKDEEEIPYTQMPEYQVEITEWGVMCGFSLSESYQASNGENFEQIYAEFNSQELTAGTDYQIYAEGNMIIFMPAEKYWVPGTFMVMCPPGAFNLSGKTSPEMYGSWQFIAPREYTFEFTPDSADNVANLSEITFTIHGATEASHEGNLAGTGSGVILSHDKYTSNGSYAGKEDFEATVTPVEGAAEPTFKLTFDPAPTETGTYTLSISYGSFLYDSKEIEPLERTYSFVSGIAGIIADSAENGAIYNLQGIKLDTELNQLPAGIYIVGGKLIKK